MARPPRFNLPDIPQHAIQRGNNKQVSFFNDKDYVVYLDKLKLYSKKYSVAVHSYVLMTNHVHLLMTPETEQGVSQMMQAWVDTIFAILTRPTGEPEHCRKVDTNRL